MLRVLVGALALAIAIAWVFSHVAPARFGVCHEIPVTIGAEATVTECQAYGLTDFGVPVAALVVGLVLLVDADIKVTLPGIGTFEKTRSGRQAANLLKEEEANLDRRADEYFDTLPAPDGDNDGTHE